MLWGKRSRCRCEILKAALGGRLENIALLFNLRLFLFIPAAIFLFWGNCQREKTLATTNRQSAVLRFATAVAIATASSVGTGVVFFFLLYVWISLKFVAGSCEG